MLITYCTPFLPQCLYAGKQFNKNIAVSQKIVTMACPIFQVADIVGKKWTIVILQEIALNGDKGFNHVFERIGRISPKILSRRLKDFEKEGLIIKEILADEMPVRTKYHLTQKGKELNDILTIIKKWYVKYDSRLCDCDKRECVKCPLF